jgi:hypothetical protein
LYDQLFTRQNPGCIVFLLDRSDSMKQPWQGTQSMAQGAAQALNKLLYELIVMATKGSGEVRNYCEVGVWGYGIRPVASGEGVESAFTGSLSGQALVPLDVLAENPLELAQQPVLGEPGAYARVPIWVKPVHGYMTPMCAAIAEVGAYLKSWAVAHPNSHPPIAINITDGWVSDSPYKGADLNQWAQRLTGIQTRDGKALLLNIFLSNSPHAPIFYPSTASGLPDPGPMLFDASSPLPPAMVASAAQEGIQVSRGARALVFNADLMALVKSLKVGTGSTASADPIGKEW